MISFSNLSKETVFKFTSYLNKKGRLLDRLTKLWTNLYQTHAHFNLTSIYYIEMTLHLFLFGHVVFWLNMWFEIVLLGIKSTDVWLLCVRVEHVSYRSFKFWTHVRCVWTVYSKFVLLFMLKPFVVRLLAVFAHIVEWLLDKFFFERNNFVI